MKTNIVLIGMMGTGKSAAGKRLADKLGMMFLDMDALIAYEEMPIPELFARIGEEGFRDVETKAAFRVAEFENTVISTGGGIVKRGENMEALSQGAYIVWLTASDAAVVRRVKRQPGARPLLKSPTAKSVARLREEREPLYRRWADLTVDTTGLTPARVASKITAALVRYFDQKTMERED